jgi:hypothetical protein
MLVSNEQERRLKGGKSVEAAVHNVNSTSHTLGMCIKGKALLLSRKSRTSRQRR